MTETPVAPVKPWLESFDAVNQSAGQNTRMILEHLQARGFIRPEERVEPA